MGISTRQYQDIMNEYDAARRRNYMAEQERKERIYALIPEIRRIDEEIAHVSVAKAKEMLLKKISNADAKKSLQSTIYDLSMEKVNLLAIHDYPADYLDPIYDCPECKDTGYIGDKKCHCFQRKIREILYSLTLKILPVTNVFPLSAQITILRSEAEENDFLLARILKMFYR